MHDLNGHLGLNNPGNREAEQSSSRGSKVGKKRDVPFSAYGRAGTKDQDESWACLTSGPKSTREREAGGKVLCGWTANIEDKKRAIVTHHMVYHRRVNVRVVKR